MHQGTAPDSASWSLRSRGPAHVVSHQCLAVQRSARPRRFLARLFGLDPLHPEAVGSYHSALAELRVGRMLSGLGSDWRVLHAVPLGDGGADIDHLAIGPAGIFTIAARHHPGRRIWVNDGAMFVDGQRTDDIRLAEREASVASRTLTRVSGTPIVVTPVVVVVDPAHLRYGSGRGPVTVISTRRLIEHLRGLPTVFDPFLVASIARAAEEWTTWLPFGVDSGHVDPADDFDGLRHEVARARTRRTIWWLAGPTGVTVAAFGVASALFF